ncbi:tagaturonate reductase [Rudanella lutea]|uniref:tagaturonate reductase n=1 Tax=Rudanella lutea TaxID=451374 RepID=UPI0003A72698|nr:tagaturonate reductase [Rudanella lutea]
MPALNRSTYNASTYPERVLQFGTGVLLRALPDFYIDKANKQGIFEGSIAIVKSTDGKTDGFAAQDNLYTVAVRGIQQGQSVEEITTVTAVSRVLSAQSEWKDILQIAKSPTLQVIISNTTEVGLTYVEESIFQNPPKSFPAKLTAFLYERFKDVGGSRNRGLVVIPTELVTDNGLKLREMVEKLARYNELGKLFSKWLKFHVRFCNSLVDRIVPGKPDTEARQYLAQKTGYEDDLLTVAEPYNLWAIEGDERVREILSFAQVNPGVIIDEDITFYRERKLRLLNGTHSFTTPICYLMGNETVSENMQNALTAQFIERLMLDEIVPTVPQGMGENMGPDAVLQFGKDVIDRFSNPYIEHLLLNITLHQTAKMQARNVATIGRYYEKFNTVPKLMATGFAGYLLFMKPARKTDDGYVAEANVNGGILTYPLRDDKATYFDEHWRNVEAGSETSVRQFVDAVLSDKGLWEVDLTQWPGFAEAVSSLLHQMLTEGVENTLAQQLK